MNDSKSDNPKPAYRTKLGAIKNKLSGLVSSDTWQLRLKVCNPGVLLTPMYKQFSTGTHFWKHNHHNPLVVSSQKCEVFIWLSDFTFLFGWLMLIFLEAFHLSTIRLCPHLEVLLTHGQFRLCSTGTHSHQSAQAFYQSLQGIEAFHQNAKENSPPKKNGCEWYRFWSFLLGGIWVALGFL